MPTFTDQTGEIIELHHPPKRIVSLVPSQSEYIWDLGLREELVGITKFCIHPENMYRSVEKVGGTKNLNLEKIRELKPDLIIGNLEENSKADIEVLRQEFPVWMSDIYNPEDALQMMRQIGIISGRTKESKLIIEQCETALLSIKNSLSNHKVLYFIWAQPYMVAASNTYISAMLEHIGLQNVAKHFQRYPELNDATIKELSPDLIFLSSEPYPFKETHRNFLQQILPNSKIVFTDGEMLSWYGSRMAQLPEYIEQLKKEINS